MYEPLISIIVPVYNVEQYIIKCLESVKSQTFLNYECVIVNDGTKDNSAVLVRDFIDRNKLNNFFLIEKENGGISSARNFGLDKSKGKYVYFLDSDDWMESNSLQSLVNCMCGKDVDLAIGGYRAYDQRTGKFDVWSNYPISQGVIPKDLWALHSFSFVWGRLYKKSIIDCNNLRFDERIEYAEDNAWHFDYNRYVKTYACTNDIGYNYRINREGALTSKLVTPKMKYYIGEHMFSFYDAFDDTIIKDVFCKNRHLLRVTWRVLTTSVVNDILDKKIKDAKKKRKSLLAKSANDAFCPHTKKEKIFFILWKHSFFLLRIFVLFYYGNFQKLRKSRFVQKISNI